MHLTVFIYIHFFLVVMLSKYLNIFNMKLIFTRPFSTAYYVTTTYLMFVGPSPTLPEGFDS
jgi:hypothetical protein